MGRSKYVITITRQFGSMGRPIAKRMAEKLGIEYYDRDLVDQAAEKLALPVSKICEQEESAVNVKRMRNPFLGMAYPLGNPTSNMQDKIFETQKNIIKFLAEKETCIIVGRCSDFILSEMENAMHIYVYASYESRLKNSIEDLNLEEDEARRMIASVDEARDTYHINFTGFKPDDKRYKDIMIDSSFLGVEGTADFLVEAVKRRFPDAF